MRVQTLGDLGKPPPVYKGSRWDLFRRTPYTGGYKLTFSGLGQPEIDPGSFTAMPLVVPRVFGHLTAREGLFSFVYMPTGDAVSVSMFGRVEDDLSNLEQVSVFEGQRMWGHGAMTAGALALLIGGTAGFFIGRAIKRRR